MLGNSWKAYAPIYSLLVKTRGGKWCVDVLNREFAVVANHAKRMHVDQKYPKESLQIVETVHQIIPDFILD
jgi:hypothetical protein